jgi:hypothetical protein
LAWAQDYLTDAPDRPYYFKHYFEALQDHHQGVDIRSRLQEQDFPLNEDFFMIGGNLGGPLGHLYIGFSKAEGGWVIDELGMMR